jgi:hypothetical protein
MHAYKFVGAHIIIFIQYSVYGANEQASER